jgi:hypothetical protein
VTPVIPSIVPPPSTVNIPSIWSSPVLVPVSWVSTVPSIYTITIPSRPSVVIVVTTVVLPPSIPSTVIGVITVPVPTCHCLNQPSTPGQWTWVPSWH